MSTSSLEQAILKISKVMEDFVGEQQKINSHLNEKIDNLESSMNVRMEGVYNDLSLRIEKVQNSIEKCYSSFATLVFWDFSPRVGEATKVMLTSRTGHLLDLQYNGS
ncbi:hypothetical protein CK203_038724 [Vitis vinifera]|uniref:Uncharacterized protein n=1 Tax=Vitis vinifera TaxID=29760 RepID=A0A438HUY0_VITVI|nr:hypothetical protein CK203_038724 [Vitis vinifera]